MPAIRRQKRASRRAALFSFLPLLGSLALPAGAAAPRCPADHLDQQATAEYVYDGDTVRLDDGRKLRFIGLNTPELGRDGKPDQPYARAARQAVEALLAGGQSRLGLRLGRERHDRYGRTLGHPYLQDGRSLAEVLLARGLATLLTVPPNTWNSDCYRQVEAEARAAKRGLWSLAAYQAVDSRSLGLKDHGYRLVSGRVERIGHSRSSLWLNLPGRVALRIPRRDLEYFTRYDPAQLEGRRVVAHGWLHARKGELRMTVRHPHALELLED